MTTSTEHLKAILRDSAEMLLAAERTESVSIPMGDRLILAGNPAALARMLGYSDTLAIFAATKRATRFWFGADASGHLAQLWTVEPRAEDYPHLTITAHVVMPQVDNGTPAGWEPADAPIATAAATESQPAADARLVLLLNAASGYEARHEYGRITPEQWGDILRVCEGTLKSAAPVPAAAEGWTVNTGAQPVVDGVVVEVLFKNDEQPTTPARDFAENWLWSLTDDYPISMWRPAAPATSDKAEG